MMNLLFASKGFDIFGLHITFYGLLIAVGFILAILLAFYHAKKRGLTSEDIITLAIYVIPLSILGARTYYCIFSGETFSFAEFFAIWNGGMAILGGVIGGVIAVLIYSIVHQKNFLMICDIAAPSLILGQCIGRVGCYFAGCCYGHEVTNESLQFFPISIFTNGGWHLATNFYECFWCLIGLVLLVLLFRKFQQKGVITCCYLIFYGIGRGIIETFRGDSLYFFSTGLKVSQILAIIIVIVGIIGLILIHNKYKKQNKNEKVDHK